MTIKQWTVAGLVSVVFTTGQVAAQTKKTVVSKLGSVKSVGDHPQAPKPLSITLANAIDSVSYSIGVNVGLGLKQQSLSGANLSALSKGLEDVLKDRNTQLSQDMANDYIKRYFMRQQSIKADANKKAGALFLSENKKKLGVVTLASGLQYQIVKEGTGPKPALTDTVKAHYTGRLLDGTVFDSSAERGEPLQIPVNQVIPGWSEALQLMPVGSKWKLYIPAALAYGERGAGPQIGPNATLIFDIELLEIIKRQQVSDNKP